MTADRGGPASRRFRCRPWGVLLPALSWALLALPLPPAAAQAPGPGTGAPDAKAASTPALPSVAFNGRLGERALLVINGQPRTMAVGDTVDGVRLVAVRADVAEVSMGRERLTLRLGAAPVNLGGAATPGTGSRVVLTADTGGHFVGSGQVNGRPTRFLVDTGATLVAISQAEADRLGIAFRDAPRDIARTANGDVPVHRVVLQSVRLGDVQLPMVDAVVLPAAMDHVLLGNSFLRRFQMTRSGDQMTLERRP
jgi:aspartyl protease family protein